jgi:hypothetical protein
MRKSRLCTVICWTLGDIGGPQSGQEAQFFVEGMYPWVRSPTLHEHMMAVARPCVRERGLNDGAAVPAPPQVGMGDDVLQEAVASSAAQKVWCCDEHARRCDASRSSDTKTWTPGCAKVSRQTHSARSNGSAAKLTSDAANSARSEGRSNA